MNHCLIISFLSMLNDTLTDKELLQTVQSIEAENFIGGLSDADLLQEVISLEEQFEISEMWDSDSDSQVLYSVLSFED